MYIPIPFSFDFIRKKLLNLRAVVAGEKEKRLCGGIIVVGARERKRSVTE